MGAACCVAANDRTIVSAPRGEALQRHVRTSPSWSIRWDNNPGRVAVEETTDETQLHGGNKREFKSGTTLETVFASEEDSPMESFRSLQFQKSPEGNADQESPTLAISEETSEDVGSSYMPIPYLSDLMLDNKEKNWSFDSEISAFSGCEKTCSICSNLLADGSFWAQKMISSTNELAVISVLSCGHAYHAECLEHMTPEINKYDPDCLICKFGEKKAAKMCEKALRAEIGKKARKRSRKRVIDRDITFDHQPQCSGVDTKSLQGKHFLKRHFSFGSKQSRLLLSGNQSARRKSFFWARSSSKN